MLALFPCPLYPPCSTPYHEQCFQEPNAVSGEGTKGGFWDDAQRNRTERVMYTSWAVQYHPDGGQFDFARSPARTPHEGASYV